MDVQVRVHEDFDLGGGFALTQGIHDVAREVLFNYLPEILTGNLFFPLEINQFDALNQQLNEQIYLLYKSDADIKNSIPNVPLTTKGDLLGFSTANVRVPVGADGTFLKADSAAARGVRWASIPTGITVNSTPITDGTNNNVLFQASDNVSQDSDFTFDGSNNRLTVGSAILQTPNSSSLFLGSAPNASYSGSTNVFLGFGAGSGNTVQHSNVYVGDGAGSGVSSDAYFNVFIGRNSGANTSGRSNTFVGYASGNANTTGTTNTFIGANAGASATTASANTAVGSSALSAITAGNYGNVAIGASALSALTNGDDNVCIGRNALSSLATQSFNVGVGARAGTGINTGYYNTCIGGDYAGGLISSGYSNTCIGSFSGDNITTGANNVAIGASVDVDSATGSNQTNINDTFIATSTEARIQARNFKIQDGYNLVFGTTTGSSLGATLSQKTGMHGEAIAQDTGWSVSGYTPLRNYDASTGTHADLGKAFCTLVEYLTNKGLLGT